LPESDFQKLGVLEDFALAVPCQADLVSDFTQTPVFEKLEHWNKVG
jgi:hypothetical protein